MVVDAHHHFWDPSRRAYPWLGDDLAAIRRPFGPADLAPLIAAEGIDRTVLVQTISSLDETNEFLATAASTTFVAGVVGWVDLMDPNVARVLAELRSGDHGKFLIGIRHQAHDETDPRWLLRDDVQRGIRAVGDAGLVYDLLVKSRELPSAVELARNFPDITFVLDHVAKPRIASGPRDEEWERAMAPLAECENVHCKLSGMVTEASWPSWTPDDLAPYIDRTLAWFGPGRCMFGSDWPVCLLAADYGRVFSALKLALDGLDPTEKREVLGENAVRVYRLAR